MTTTPSTSTEFVDTMRNPQTEELLRSRGVDFTPTVMAIEAIDEEASLRNQARLAPFKMNTVDNYAAAMDRNEQFPAIVVRRSGKRFVVVDGNHRLLATKKVGGDEIPAYVLHDVADELVRVLIVELNRKHGAPLSDDERLLHAMHLIDMGANVTDAAEAVGLPTAKVRRERNRLQADRRAHDLNLGNVWNKLNVSTQAKLAPIHSDQVFTELARFAADGKLTGQQVKEALDEVNKARTEQAQLATVANMRDLMRQQIQMSAGGVFRPSTNRSRPLLMAAMANISKLNIDEIVASTVPENKEELAQRCVATAEKLREYADKLSR